MITCENTQLFRVTPLASKPEWRTYDAQVSRVYQAAAMLASAWRMRTYDQALQAGLNAPAYAPPTPAEWTLRAIPAADVQTQLYPGTLLSRADRESWCVLLEQGAASRKPPTPPRTIEIARATAAPLLILQLEYLATTPRPAMRAPNEIETSRLHELFWHAYQSRAKRTSLAPEVPAPKAWGEAAWARAYDNRAWPRLPIGEWAAIAREDGHEAGRKYAAHRDDCRNAFVNETINNED